MSESIAWHGPFVAAGSHQELCELAHLVKVCCGGMEWVARHAGSRLQGHGGQAVEGQGPSTCREAHERIHPMVGHIPLCIVPGSGTTQ